MFRGLYTAALGMMSQLWRTDVAANNLANAATPGFRRDVPVMGAFPQVLLRRLNDPGGQAFPGAGLAPAVGAVGRGAAVEEVAVDQTAAAVQVTDSPWDLAIMGPGFFVVQTPEGPAYTRRGRFELGADGSLLTSEGYPVMGRDGPLQPGAGQFQVAEDGTILVDGEARGRLAVVDFPVAARVSRRGQGLFLATAASGGPVAVQHPRLRQGALEGSNVNLVEEMVGLISAFRAFEAGQKAVQAMDQALGRAVNDVAR